MSPRINRAARAFVFLSVILAGLFGFGRVALAQPVGQSPVHFRVSGPVQTLEMTVKTSRILTMDFNVPKLVVENEEIMRARPMSPNQIHVSAMKTGITALYVWDENNEVHAVEVRVFGDVRELQNYIDTAFPSASVQVRPLNASLRLTGTVPDANTSRQINEVASDYFPTVMNHIQVGGNQTVLLHVKILEVSRTKLRRLGVDWAAVSGNDFVVQSVSGLIAAAAAQSGTLAGAGDTLRFGVINNNGTFGAFIDMLQQNNLAKLLAEPTIVATSGRAARFVSGGEVPVPVNGGLGVTSVEYREFGAIVDFLPMVMGDGYIRLEVRPDVTEIDASLRDPNTGVPGFRRRGVDTGVVMKAGQTLALAGLIQKRTEAEKKGLPWISDIPFLGAPFRRVQESVNEVELLIIVTPELVSPVDPHMMPPCGPGQSTTSPADHELYFDGYLEVPTCCPDASCPHCVSEGTVAPLAPVEELKPEDLPSGQNPMSLIHPRGGRQPSIAPGVRTSPNGTGRVQGTSTTRVNTINTANPDNRNNATRLPPEAHNNVPNTKPTIIGPIGYGVLD